MMEVLDLRILATKKVLVNEEHVVPTHLEHPFHKCPRPKEHLFTQGVEKELISLDGVSFVPREFEARERKRLEGVFQTHKAAKALGGDHRLRAGRWLDNLQLVQTQLGVDVSRSVSEAGARFVNRHINRGGVPVGVEGEGRA